VALNWRPSKPSSSKAHGQNMVAKNRRAVQDGVTTAAGFTAWHKENSIQRRVVKGSKRTVGNKPPVADGTTYGRPSIESEHVPDLLSAQVLALPDRDYPNMQNQVRAGRLPLPRPTRSSEINQSYNRTMLHDHAKSQGPQKLWQMKKYERIGPSIDRYGRDITERNADMDASLASLAMENKEE